MMLALEEPTLLHEAAPVGGCLIDASGDDIAVTNPTVNEEIDHVPNVGAAETHEAIEAAQSAQKASATSMAKDCSNVLRRWIDLAAVNQADLARILTAEQGKPLAETTAEVGHGASFIEWFSEEARCAYSDITPARARGKRILTTKRLIGVVAAITSSKFPNAMISRKAAPAFAAGCVMVLKPSEMKPFSVIVMAACAQEAVISVGFFSVLTGGAQTIGQVMTDSPTMRKLTFTRSTGVGANRNYVQAAVYDVVKEKLAAKGSELQIGNGFDQGGSFGPLINDGSVCEVQAHVMDAKAKRAPVILNGKPHDMSGTFFEPTILKGVTSGLVVATEKTFGPVASLFNAEVLKAANDTHLASYFFSSNHAGVWRVSEARKYGMVGVSTELTSTSEASFWRGETVGLRAQRCAAGPR